MKTASPLQKETLEFTSFTNEGKATQNPLQLKTSSIHQNPLQLKKENKTGLPDGLKAGVEELSGYSMDDVQVHYNSDKPAQLQAHAYAQGTHIHIAPGQEKHLPHEAWHVVQQKQGRVRPTVQMKSKLAVNDDKGLETEADNMGARAICAGTTGKIAAEERSFRSVTNTPTLSKPFVQNQPGVIQAVMIGGKNVTFTPGYASWDGWHINWRLGDTNKKGKEVYHVTNEKGKKHHYFFTLDAGEIEDAVAPKGFSGKKTSHKFSVLPDDVQQYIIANIVALQG